jgi:SAM-dependent methyltransferase
VLDVGCCFGFLPMLLAEWHPELRVVGCDLVPATAALANRVASSLSSRARFAAADAGRLPVRPMATDTVLAVHLLEHLPAESTAPVLAELCRAARRRVVVAVPLESSPDRTFGHMRAFDLGALAALGAASGWRGEVHELDGGWLVLDRTTSPFG